MPKIEIEVSQEQLDALRESGEKPEEVIGRILYRKSESLKAASRRSALLEDSAKKRENRS